MESPILFVSYSHDSDVHRATVLSLAERLRVDGYDCRLDQYVNGAPTEGWARWMMNQLDDAAFVLVVCTETYYRRFRGHEQPEKGKGADWEGALITQEIYDSRSTTLKFVPILLDQDGGEFVPEPLRSLTYYTLNSEASYESLCRFLDGVAGIRPRPLGKRKPREPEFGSPISFQDKIPDKPGKSDRGVQRHIGGESQTENGVGDKGAPGRKLAAGIFLIALIPVLALFGWMLWPPPKCPVVRVGIKQFVGYTPLAIAKEMELFDGIDVEFVTIGDLSETRELFEHDKIDVVMWLVNWHAEYTGNGNPANVVLKLDTSLGADAIVAGNSIASASDIRSRLDNNELVNVVFQLDEPSHYLMNELCHQHGFDLIRISATNAAERTGKIGYSHASPSEAAQLLKFGDRDGTIYHAAGTYEPYLRDLLAPEVGRTILISGAHRPDSIVDVLAVKPDFLAKNRTCVEALIRGWFEAVDILDAKGNDARHFRAVELARRFNYLLPPDKKWHADEWPTYPALPEQDYLDMVKPEQIRFADREANRHFFRVVAGKSTFRDLFRRAQDQLHAQGRFARTTRAEEADGSGDIFEVFAVER